MGRKFKIAFSSSESDSALTYMHDLGFIPKIKKDANGETRGFKVLIGGGLGGQAFLAKTAHEFLSEDLIIPFSEAVLRVFDRNGERINRNKARLKFLINKIGFEAFMNLVEQEKEAIKTKSFKVNHQVFISPEIPDTSNVTSVEISDQSGYQNWLDTNVFEQKQSGYFGVYIKVLNGDVKTEKARKFADIVTKYAADDIRITINQGLLLKFVAKNVLPNLYTELNAVQLADPGFDSTIDITSCPGTDTCNLGITSSTGVTVALEQVIKNEFPDLIHNTDIKIKISGCMNACGQHTIANIGFHGSSIKVGVNTVPALQVLIGGGTIGNGEGRLADKIIKIPSKRAPDVLRFVLLDYEENANEGEYFNDYYDRQGKEYFYFILKPLKDLTNLTPDEFIDWGHDVQFETAIGIGECAGVLIDLVATLLYEAEEKLEWATETFAAGQFADSIYHSYNCFIGAAKALLIDKEVTCNTQSGIINDFDKHYVLTGLFTFATDFKGHVLRINENEPSKQFAETFLNEAKQFVNTSNKYRQNQLNNAKYE